MVGVWAGDRARGKPAVGDTRHSQPSSPAFFFLHTLLPPKLL